MTTTDTQASAITTTETTDVSPVGGDASPPSGETPVPTPPALPPRAAKVKEYSILGRVTVGVMLLAVGILAIFDNIEGVPVYAEPRHYMALAVTILGLGLLVGAVWGRARWLILVAVVLVPTMLFSPVFEYDWSSEAFDVSHQPMTFLEIESIYTLDLGNMVIDLTELPWDGDVVDITARVDVGNLEIRIPNDVGIIGSASVDVGRVGSPGRESAGLGDPRLNFNSSGTEGTVMLDAQVDLGNIDIRRG